MRQRFSIEAYIFALVTCGIFLCSELAGQNAPTVSLQGQLQARYKLVKTGADASGLTVVEPGTVLAVQKDDFLGVDPKSAVFCPSKFQDGDLKCPNLSCVATVRQSSRFLRVGEKVYPTKIEVNLDNDTVVFEVMECDSCNGVKQSSFLKSEVSFQFAKGSLRNASIPQVEGTISQALAIDSGGDSQKPDTSVPQDQMASSPQQPQPCTIEEGQTIDHVVAALGQPDGIVNQGAKQFYSYKDLTVIFADGKVLHWFFTGHGASGWGAGTHRGENRDIPYCSLAANGSYALKASTDKYNYAAGFESTDGRMELFITVLPKDVGNENSDETNNREVRKETKIDPGAKLTASIRVKDGNVVLAVNHWNEEHRICGCAVDESITFTEDDDGAKWLSNRVVHAPPARGMHGGGPTFNEIVTDETEIWKVFK